MRPLPSMSYPTATLPAMSVTRFTTRVHLSTGVAGESTGASIAPGLSVEDVFSELNKQY